MARQAKREKKREEKVEVSEDLQEKCLRFLVLKACISRLESEQKEVRSEIDLLMQEEDAKAFDIMHEGEIIGDVKPRRQRSFALKERTKLASLVSIRQLLELVSMDAKTYDALEKLFKDDKEKLKLLRECVVVSASESTTISKKRNLDQEKYAKAAMEKAAKEAEEAVQQLLAALKEGADDPLVEQLLESEEEFVA